MTDQSSPERTSAITGKRTLLASKLFMLGGVGTGIWVLVAPGSPNSTEVIVAASGITSGVALHFLGKMSIEQGGMHPPEQPQV